MELFFDLAFVSAFFGIRGFGSIYYLSYALGEADFPHGDELWAIVSLALLISITVHGVTASRAMGTVDRVVNRTRPDRGRSPRGRPRDDRRPNQHDGGSTGKLDG